MSHGQNDMRKVVPTRTKPSSIQAIKPAGTQDKLEYILRDFLRLLQLLQRQAFLRLISNQIISRRFAAFCRLGAKLLMLFVGVLNISCDSGNVSHRSSLEPKNRPVIVATPPPQAEKAPYVPDQFGVPVGDFIKSYTKESTVSYLGYEIVKSKRQSKIGPPKGETEIEYAVLHHNGRVVAKFDSPIDQLSEIRFGLFSFLGKDDKQLIVEQTSDKFWRYWIVSLQPEFRMLYDSQKYDVVYELRVGDLDHDGYLEIVQNLGTFWYFNSDNVFSPRPHMIFKYNSSLGRYIPSNPEFKETVLKDIEQRIDKTRQVAQNRDDPAYDLHLRSAVLDVVLRYLYTGEQASAWAFYDQNYKVEDKESLQVQLKTKLMQDALYREMISQAHVNR
jgi:hypothetical protein